MQVLARRLPHPGGDGRREERRLPGRGGAGDDALDVRREAAVEHLVGLVEDEEADAVEPERALVEQVEHAAGRADDDVHAAPQRVALRTQGAAAEDQGGDHTARPPSSSRTPPTWTASSRVGVRTRTWTTRWLDRRFGGRDAEGERFARAGAGLADDVSNTYVRKETHNNNDVLLAG